MSDGEGRRLVRTAEAARELAIAPSTLTRWAQQGIVEPATRTAGGQARWDMERLREQIQAHLNRGGSTD